MSNQKTIRAFTAFKLNPETNEQLSEIAVHLKKHAPEIRPVKADKIHLTLHFFESLNSKELKAVQESCRTAIKGAEPMTISLDRFGFFPEQKNPHIIWVGIQKGNEAVKEFKKKLDRELDARGIALERRAFKPHITIARIKTRFSVEKLKNELVYFDKKISSTEIFDKFYLIKSTLQSDGPVYEVLEEFGLESDK